jgi:zinc/manganese transport system permease protein
MEELFRYAFLQHAFAAGAFAALGASVLGFFLINRGMTFASHALPNIGFAGAAGAVLLGLPPSLGLFAFMLTGSVGFAFLGREAHSRDVGIGVGMSFALGTGLFFLASYSGYAERVYGILFGSILGVSETDVWQNAAAGALALTGVAALYRPLLFSTVDPEQARARGVPDKLLGVVFMILVAVTMTAVVPVTGALLVFTLTVTPTATAMRLSRRPGMILLLSVVLAESIVFISIVLAATLQDWPVSFFVSTLSFVTYLAVFGLKRLAAKPRRLSWNN